MPWHCKADIEQWLVDIQRASTAAYIQWANSQKVRPETLDDLATALADATGLPELITRRDMASKFAQHGGLRPEENG